MNARKATSTALPNVPTKTATKIDESTPVTDKAPNPTAKVIAIKGPLFELLSISLVVHGARL
jgi:hypothetical protein